MNQLRYLSAQSHLLGLLLGSHQYKNIHILKEAELLTEELINTRTYHEQRSLIRNCIFDYIDNIIDEITLANDLVKYLSEILKLYQSDPTHLYWMEGFLITLRDDTQTSASARNQYLSLLDQLIIVFDRLEEDEVLDIQTFIQMREIEQDTNKRLINFSAYLTSTLYQFHLQSPN